MSKKVCILGAGVGGLSAAHELIKKNYEVEVYERNPIPGGQARSDTITLYQPSSGKGHSEYCWHVVGRGYHHLLSILKEIPSVQEGNVSHHLKPMTQFYYARENGHFSVENGNSFVSQGDLIKIYQGIRNAGGEVRMNDLWILVKMWLIANCGCNKRIEDYDNQLWSDVVDGLSNEMKKWIVDSPSIYLGMDIDKLSAELMLHMLKTTTSTDLGDYDFYSFNGPANQVWFRPWVEYLKEQGVKFYFNCEVKNINVINDKISNVQVQHENSNNVTTLFADYYVNGLSIEGFAKCLDTTNEIYLTKQKKLAIYSRQIQTQVLYYFDLPFDIDEPTIVVLPDTPWCLMFRHEGALWNLTKGDLLSVGIGIWSRKGIYHDKIASECTRQELAEEVWAQLRNNPGLLDNMKFEGGSRLRTVKDLPDWNIWFSYTYDYDMSTGQRGIDTWEPKFSNNQGTLALRPEIKDDTISNLLHATAYAKTDANIFCMESAAEAGRRAANFIDKGTTKNDIPRFKSNYLFRIIKWIDSKLYRN